MRRLMRVSAVIVTRTCGEKPVKSVDQRRPVRCNSGIAWRKLGFFVSVR